MEDLIKIFTVGLASVIEGLAAVCILAAIIRSLYAGLRSIRMGVEVTAGIRLQLGSHLALALELLLAADILRTAVSPTWSDIGKLAAIAVLRTLLNYFLERELKGHARQGVPNQLQTQ